MVKKKVVPKTESLILNGLLKYSNPWTMVNITPKIIVATIHLIQFLPDWMQWWAHVTVTPEDKRRAVFNKGTAKGSKGKTDKGGHAPPSSNVGTIAAWKKAQNHLKKNKISDPINNPIPHFNPSWTALVWSPSKAPSRIASRHHNKLTNIMVLKEIKTKDIWLNLNEPTKQSRRAPLEAPANSGQGETETKWKKW